MADDSDSEVTAKDIAIIADSYLIKWEQISPYLNLGGVTDEEVRRTPGGYLEQKKALLGAWKLQRGRRATFRVLIAAAESARNMELADNLRSMLDAKLAERNSDIDGSPEKVISSLPRRDIGGSIQADSGRGGKDTVRRRAERDEHNISTVNKPPSSNLNETAPEGWKVALPSGSLGIFIVIAILLICGFVFLWFYRVTESVLCWILAFILWKMFCKEIPWRDFHLDEKNGILILVTSSYNGSLRNTRKDRVEMIVTFTQLNYHIAEFRDKDASRSKVLLLLKQLSNYLSWYSGPPKQALVFAFSGHGGSGEIQLDDLKTILVMDDILGAFVKHRNVFKMPKLLFIDACRGGQELTKSLQRKSLEQSVAEYETIKGIQHKVGNYLIAYATIDKHVAFDGNWMHKLAKKIRNNLNYPLTSILNNLAGELPKYQQTELVVRLRGDFSFDCDD